LSASRRRHGRDPKREQRFDDRFTRLLSIVNGYFNDEPDQRKSRQQSNGGPHALNENIDRSATAVKRHSIDPVDHDVLARRCQLGNDVARSCCTHRIQIDGTHTRLVRCAYTCLSMLLLHQSFDCGRENSIEYVAAPVSVACHRQVTCTGVRVKICSKCVAVSRTDEKVLGHVLTLCRVTVRMRHATDQQPVTQIRSRFSLAVHHDVFDGKQWIDLCINLRRRLHLTLAESVNMHLLTCFRLFVFSSLDLNY
jgi:hypothetical protein